MMTYCTRNKVDPFEIITDDYYMRVFPNENLDRDHDILDMVLRFKPGELQTAIELKYVPTQVAKRALELIVKNDMPEQVSDLWRHIYGGNRRH